jgi:hypothetical protein
LLSIAARNVLDNQHMKIKGLFWLIVLEVPVDDYLSPLLCVHGKLAHYDGKRVHLTARK